MCEPLMLFKKIKEDQKKAIFNKRTIMDMQDGFHFPTFDHKNFEKMKEVF